MPNPLTTILAVASAVAKNKVESLIVCPCCGERFCLIKHGFYERYVFSGADTVKIQRHRCLNDRCTRQTFSCLPHPFLPVIRLPLCFLLELLDQVLDQGRSIGQVARDCGMHWAVIRRALQRAVQLKVWMNKEAVVARWGPSPCFGPQRSWTLFAQSVSFAFFPEQF